MPRAKLLYGLGLIIILTTLCTIWVYEDVPLMNKAMMYFTTTPPLPSSAVPQSRSRTYLVLHPSEPWLLTSHPETLKTDFTSCTYSNCFISWNMSDFAKSDAVIITGRNIGRNNLKQPLKRTQGQIWIFHSSESPVHYDLDGTIWRTDPIWRHGFNWSMTYDRNKTDIYLPYGEIVRKSHKQARNYTEVALRKTKDALLVSSNCGNPAKREEYAKRLRKYISVDHFGACGEKWSCGERYFHDNCFEVLNTTYRFYLAFENSLCQAYFTEKFFKNFNYDVLTVTRGGRVGEAAERFPKGTVISTDSFESVDALGKYLSDISHSVDKYASLIEIKDQFESLPVKVTYQRALCHLCDMLNHQEQYRRLIPDTSYWAFNPNVCRSPSD